MERFFLTESNSSEDAVLIGRLPMELWMPGNSPVFDALWAMRPEAYHTIIMHGRAVQTPRWQQAYGADYHYTGNTNQALPVTPELQPFLAWAKAALEPRLNGLLLNWYEGTLGHYIGAHRDSTKDMIEGTAIVTISLGEERAFRFRPYKTKAGGFIDIPVANGSVVVIPWGVNQRFTHEVPAPKGKTGRRISITLRAFATRR